MHLERLILYQICGVVHFSLDPCGDRHAAQLSVWVYQKLTCTCQLASHWWSGQRLSQADWYSRSIWQYSTIDQTWKTERVVVWRAKHFLLTGRGGVIFRIFCPDISFNLRKKQARVKAASLTSINPFQICSWVRRFFFFGSCWQARWESRKDPRARWGPCMSVSSYKDRWLLTGSVADCIAPSIIRVSLSTPLSLSNGGGGAELTTRAFADTVGWLDTVTQRFR